jgi:hypothetical protein
MSAKGFKRALGFSGERASVLLAAAWAVCMALCMLCSFYVRNLPYRLSERQSILQAGAMWCAVVASAFGLLVGIMFVSRQVKAQHSSGSHGLFWSRLLLVLYTLLVAYILYQLGGREHAVRKVEAPGVSASKLMLQVNRRLLKNA